MTALIISGACVVYAVIGGIISAWFLYVWGWGDAAWGNKDIHPGNPNDLWHKRRRFAFYALLMWASLPNPIAWVVLLFGRRIFRNDVWDVDGGETYRRWYGGAKGGT